MAPNGFSASAGGRFDEKDLTIRRADVEAAYTAEPLILTGRYTYIQAQPLLGFPAARQEIEATSTFLFAENWGVFGQGVYDLQSNRLVNSGIGLGYTDECFFYSLFMTETRSINGTIPDELNIGFNIKLRTLGEFSSDIGKLEKFVE